MYKKYLISIVLLYSCCAFANTDLDSIDQLVNRDYLSQKQQIDQLSQSITPFIQLQGAVNTQAYPWLEREPICFPISSIELTVPDTPLNLEPSDFYLALRELKYSDHKVLGQCIGGQGLAGVVNYVNEQLIQLGYVSSQVIVQDQDLSTGHLVLTLVPGLIGEIRIRNQRGQYLNYRLPISAEDLLNLRNIEQVLETFSRLQGVSATFDILPSKKQGEDVGYSDVVIVWDVSRRHFLNLGLNDSGSMSSGRYQSSVSYTFENPLYFSDSLFLHYTKSITGWNVANYDYNNLYFSYEVPYKDWLFNLNLGQYTNIQQLEGYDGNWIDYSTENTDVNLQALRELSRGRNYRWSGYVQGYHKAVSSFINEVEIEVQRKRTAGWEIGSKHQLQLGSQTLNSQISYRKGTGAFGNETAEDFTGEGNSRASIWSASLHYSLPWQSAGQQFVYQANWLGQWSPQDLIGLETFSMGGRYNLRGYRSEQSIMGNNGHYLQQTMHWLNPAPHLSFYAGIDQGLVSGNLTEYYSGRYMLGSVLGVRSQFKHMNGDFFIGKGLIAPKHVDKESIAGFSLSLNF